MEIASLGLCKANLAPWTVPLNTVRVSMVSTEEYVCSLWEKNRQRVCQSRYPAQVKEYQLIHISGKRTWDHHRNLHLIQIFYWQCVYGILFEGIAKSWEHKPGLSYFYSLYLTLRDCNAYRIKSAYSCSFLFCPYTHYTIHK